METKTVERNWGLDLLRILAAFTVVMLHVSPQAYLDVEIASAPWNVMNAITGLCCWNVSAFFMLSGAFLLAPQKAMSTRTLYRKNIARLAAAFVFWSAVYALTYCLLRGKGKWTFLNELLRGHYHMWFVFTLISLYAVVPLLRKITESKKATEYFLLIGFLFTYLIGRALNFALLFELPHKDVLQEMCIRDSAYTLRHGELIRPSLRRVRLTRAVFSEIMRSGLPTLLRQGATSVSAALLSRVSAGFGAPVLAGMGLCARAIMPFTSAVIGFGQGFQPVCGAAFGAKQTARCQEAYRFCQRVAIAFSLAAGLAFFVFAPALAARFAPDAQSAEAARRALRLQSVAFPAQSAVILMTMLTQAMGLTLRASLVATSRQALFFLPLLAVLPRLFGLWGLLACQSASDLAALGFSLALTRRLRGSSSARCGCSDARTACRSHPRSSS